MKRKLRQDYVRREVRRHNSYLGQTAMALRAMDVIEGAPTVTDNARLLARNIGYELRELYDLLGTRIEDMQALVERIERQAYLERLAEAVEYGRRVGIDEVLVNPLVEAIKRLSENIITHQPEA